ncbi:MAG: GNAT family N-acetyltransferase [Thermoplasmatota archaeon]
MIVRKAELKDAEQIAKNNVLMAKESENQILSSDTVLKGVKAMLSDETKGFYLVAVEKDVILGQLMITFEWSDWRNQTIWWVQSVYIKEEYRKKGIFTQLLKEIKKIAEQNDISLFRLYVFNQNDKAIEVYKKLGWEKEPYLFFQKNIDSI